MNCRTICCKIVLVVFVLLVMAIVAVPALAQTCLQDEYNKVQKQKLNCTANDVSIAAIKNITDLQGNPISTCFQGTTFSFIADFEIKTTSSQARENVGLYIATNSTTQALTGSCVDNIISPANSAQYHETDPPPDNCGDTQSSDFSPLFGAGTEDVRLRIDNFSCVAPKGSTTLVLPNCTSWQIPGGTIQCVAAAPNYDYPFNGPGGTPTAIPGSPAKCNCDVISLPITPVTVAPVVQKACTTATSSPNPPTFDPGFENNPPTSPTQSPTTCDAGAEGSTVTYTVAISNPSTISGNNVVVDQICDDQYGNVFTASGFTPACPAGKSGIAASNVDCPPAPIAPGATGKCTFTAKVGENLTGLTDTVSASGHSSANATSTFTNTQSNPVTVTSSDAPSTATVTKGVVATEAACATVRYSVDVANTSGADEVLTLSALNDSPYGDITTCKGSTAGCTSGGNASILGTTCGVANGVGTLAGSAGAGALSTTIAVGGHYQCAFDAQFCSALDNNSCISHSDKVTGTLAGDEGETVTQTGNTLTVQECVTTHTSSTVP